MRKIQYLLGLFLTSTLLSNLSIEITSLTRLLGFLDWHADKVASQFKHAKLAAFITDRCLCRQNCAYIRAGYYPYHTGSPINIGYWIEKSPPTIADINNDGSNELLVPP